MDELALVQIDVGVLHSVWVALNTAECVVGHWLTGLVGTLVFIDTMLAGKVLMIVMWMVCL